MKPRSASHLERRPHVSNASAQLQTTRRGSGLSRGCAARMVRLLTIPGCLAVGLPRSGLRRCVPSQAVRL